MSSSATNIPTDVNRLIGSVDLEGTILQVAHQLSPLFIDNHMAEVMRHPISDHVLFRSDRRYFLDDAHGSIPVNPFSMSAFGNASIVDEQGKLVMTAIDYWKFIGWCNVSYEASERVMNLAALIVQQDLNGVQKWCNRIDYEFMIDHADDVMLARLVGREDDFVKAMNDAGHYVDTRGVYSNPLFSGARSLGAYGSDITAAQFVSLVQASKGSSSAQQNAAMHDTAQYNRIKPIRRITFTDSDELEDELAAELMVREEYDTIGLEGIIVPSRLTRNEYVHHVSQYGASSAQILNAYVLCKELEYCMEDIAYSVQKAIQGSSNFITQLLRRSDEPGFGWDVFHCRAGGKNKIEIHYVHDLRIHEWESKNEDRL